MVICFTRWINRSRFNDRIEMLVIQKAHLIWTESVIRTFVWAKSTSEQKLNNFIVPSHPFPHKSIFIHNIFKSNTTKRKESIFYRNKKFIWTVILLQIRSLVLNLNVFPCIQPKIINVIWIHFNKLSLKRNKIILKFIETLKNRFT